MDDLISRAAVVKVMNAEGYTKNMRVHKYILDIPAIDAVPIKALSVWLAGYAVPPKYTVGTNPVDSAKARAEGWEKHIRNLIECGLMEEE